MSKQERRPRYVPVDTLVAFSPFGTKLYNRWGMEGLCSWVLLLAAAKREPLQGTFTYTSEAEAWTKLGATALAFGFDEFVTFCGRQKQTKRTRSGRINYVEITGWKRWNNAWKNQQDSERNASKSGDSSATNSLPAGDVNASEVEVDLEVEGELELEPLSRNSRQVCQNCGVGGGLHVVDCPGIIARAA